MRFFGKLALASAMATATVTAAALPVAAYAAKKDKEQAKEQPSEAFATQYNAIANLLNAGDPNGARTAYEQMAAGVQNEHEKYLAGKLAIQVAKRTSPRDQALMERGSSMILTSTATPAEERGAAGLDAALAAYNQGRYDAALTYAQQARSAGYKDSQLEYVSALSELGLGRMSGFDSMRAAIAAANSAGSKVDEQWLALTTQAAIDWNKGGADATVQAKANEELSYWARTLLEAYPRPNNWRTALDTYINSAGTLSEEDLEDIYRLRAYTNSLTSAEDYARYVSSASRGGEVMNPNEVLRWLNAGIDAGVIDRASVSTALQGAENGKVYYDKNSPSLEQQAVSGKAVRSLSSAADHALDEGRYARAIELYDMAVTAGFNADNAALRKGVSNYELGNYAAARSNFESVSGATMKGLAGYWLYFMDQQGR